jgi:hypothetical protein
LPLRELRDPEQADVGHVDGPQPERAVPLQHLADCGVPEPAQLLGQGSVLGTHPDGSHGRRRGAVHRLVSVQRHPVRPAPVVEAHVVRVPRQGGEGLRLSGVGPTQPVPEQAAGRGLGHHEVGAIGAQRHAVREGEAGGQHGGIARGRVVPQQPPRLVAGQDDHQVVAASSVMHRILIEHDVHQCNSSTYFINRLDIAIKLMVIRYDRIVA